MKIRTVLTVIAAASVLAACRDGGGSLATAAPQTVTSLASAQIASNTNEIALPLNVNSTAISDADTDETSEPSAVN